MKNKKVVIAGIILIILILVIVGILVFMPKKVDTFSDVKLLNSCGEEISNYNENKMPFTLEKQNDKTEITVNGNKYNGERFYKPGEYIIVVTDGINRTQSVVKINQIEESQRNEYNIYMTTETLQTLFTNLKLASNGKEKGYMWTARDSTVDANKIKENFPDLQISEFMGEKDDNKFIANVLPEVKEYVKNVLKTDENAYFNVYAEEIRFYFDLEIFGKIGLDDSRYNISMYTTGTIGYVREYEITQENKYERFQKEKDNYFKIVDGIKNNTYAYNEHPGSYLVDKESPVFNSNYNYDYMLISTLRSNIQYLLQYPEMIEFKDENIANEMKKANIVKINAQEEYNKLTEEQKQLFFTDIKLDKKELDSTYFQDENAKYLVITGTAPFYENHTKEEFQNMIEQISNEYGKEYIILYKPHPRALPDEEQQALLNSFNIKSLPGSIPMEAILFIYPNLKIGGFGSSLYMSADTGKTEFFFAENKEFLVEPLNQLYDDMFSNAKFVQPK